MDKKVVFLEGDRLYLRPNELDDVDRVTRWINDPVTRQWLGRAVPFNRVREEEWIRAKYKEHGDMTLAIVLKDGDRHIGNAGLHGIDHLNQRATTGMLIGEEDGRGKGFGTEAKELLLEYAFNTLNLRTVRSSTFAGNTASMRSLAKCGYVEVGRWPDGFFREGRWHDEVLWAVTREAWNARKK